MSNGFRRALLGAITGTGVATAAMAEVPAVAADIAPVHGLVARVMEGLGTPSLVVRPGASPHGYAMRPSEAGALADADAVFWVGPELTPWLAESIGTLAEGAATVALLNAEGTRRLEFRQGATFEAHSHHHDADHGHHDHGDHAHDDHEAEGHDHGSHDDHARDEDDHDDHAREHDAHGGDGHDHAEDAGTHAGHDHDDEEGHDHSAGATDPHAWLDPENARVWLDVIAAELSRLDPENAERYAANAAAGKEEIAAISGQLRQDLAPLRDTPFVVFHDAYQYFEVRFGVSAAGAISLSDATEPGPARVEEIRDMVVALDVRCVFSEPQFNQGLVETVLDGTGGRAGTIDPMGSDIPTGPDFYPRLLREVGAEMAACLS